MRRYIFLLNLIAITSMSPSAYALDFNTNDIGTINKIDLWVVGFRDIKESVLNLGNRIDGMRVGGVQEYAPEADGRLSALALDELRLRMEKQAQIPGNVACYSRCFRSSR